jgi:hypothetical protein
MKSAFIYLFLLGLFVSSCTASMKTIAEEQFRDNSFSIDSVDEYGIALLPITGSNHTFNSVVAIAADDVLQIYEFENFVDHRQVSNDLNSENLVGEYQEMINNYHSSGIADNTQLRKIGEATGTRYLLKIQIGSLNREANTETDYFDGSVRTREEKDVRIYGLLWDASNGNVAWEGASTAVASESEFTEIRQLDNEFYQAATTELIHQLLSPNSY